MKSARHQLILLGFICQGMSWDDWLLPVFYTGLWALCLGVPRRPVRIGPVGEILVLALGCVAGFVASAALGRNTHFFIGHGLAFMQAARLMRPLNSRERMFSFLIACFHLAVACTFVFDLRFIGILIAALILVPRALQELATGSFSGTAPVTPPRRPSVASIAAITAFTAVFFVCFPRLFVGPPLQMRLFGSAGEGSLRESMIDPSRTGLAQSSRVLMQVEGQDIGYLRCFSLVDTDGRSWLAPERAPLKRFDYRTREQLDSFPHRRVRVKNAGFLERLLPTDGQAVQAGGNFFSRPHANAHGGVEAVAMWNTANNIYEYWTDPQPKPEPLIESLRRRYTSAPPPTERVRRWLDDVLGGTTDPFAQAKKLESHLRDQFTYTLGAPELNRLNTLEDFLFNQRQGHCERFAASLALLLRYQDIPTRMVVGYLPQARNILTGATAVRFKDAHSWTEAWFEGRGWVTLDATPPLTEVASSWSFRGLLEDLDFAWSSYIVNLDAPTQRQLFAVSFDALQRLPGWLVARGQPLLATVLVALLVLVAWRLALRRRSSNSTAARSLRESQRRVLTLYDQMTGILASDGFHRLPSATPLEFQLHLSRSGFPRIAEVETITRLFCLARYKGQRLSHDELASISEALKRLRAPR
jgi:transglutaminase-like putative cysteine protease